VVALHFDGVPRLDSLHRPEACREG
jgi:hypothetical protein